MHTPKRARWTSSLVLWLTKGYRVRLITDQQQNLWENAVRALTSAEPGDTHLLILQDDILPCRDLIETAQKIIEVLPNEIVTLFTNHPNAQLARRGQVNYLKLRKWLMAQAYIVPVEVAADFVQWCEKNVDPKIYFDDNRWAMYCWYHHRYVWATVPSLVDHQGWNETMLRNYQPDYQFEPRIRMAQWFIGFENSGLSIDWTKTANAIVCEDGNNADFCSYLLPNSDGNR